MSDRNFRDLIEARWALGKFVCVGLDSNVERVMLPATAVWSDGAGDDGCAAILWFNKEIVSTTHDLVAAYKINAAEYVPLGARGTQVLKETMAYIRHIAPNVPVILDNKRSDIGNSNLGYVREAFDLLDADAVTVQPYLGAEALRPFLDCTNKGIFVLCRTSNPGAGEFQDLLVNVREPLYQVVARHVVNGWNTNGNCGLVVGATYPGELEEVRDIVGDMPLLIPGIGHHQGGDVLKTVRAGKDSRGRGMIINSSRDIIFASPGADFAEAARHETLKLHEAITQQLP